MSEIKIERVVMEILEEYKNRDQLVTIHSSDNEPIKGFIAPFRQYGDTFKRVPIVEIEQVAAQPAQSDEDGFKRSGKKGWILIPKITKILEE